MDQPLVSVICMCYNHATFVQAALDSVYAQSYPAIELIISDDGSSDGSDEKIITWAANHPDARFLINEQNLGYCKSFNKALRLTKGKYIIDLAADDTLDPERVTKGVRASEKQAADYGVNFCDVNFIDGNGNTLGTHFKRNAQGQLEQKVPEGDIFIDLLGRYVVAAPSMMSKREVLEKLGGYDETLTYEDFDFWIRSSRNYKYCFTNELLVNKRLLADSLSSGQYGADVPHFVSTFKVCRKAALLCVTKEEYKALQSRVLYELRQCMLYGHKEVAQSHLDLLKECELQNSKSAIWSFILKTGISLKWLGKWQRRRNWR